MIRRVALHTLLFAVFPTLFLYVHNLELYSPRVIPLPLALSLGLALILLLLFRWISRDWTKAALLASITLVLFFSYGHLHELLRGIRIPVGSVLIGPNRVLVPFMGIAFLAAAWAILRARRPPGGLATIMNVVAVALMGMTLLNFGVRLARGGFGGRSAGAWSEEATLQVAPASLERAQPLPDIYYIILDGYARFDVLHDLYAADDTALGDALRECGFHVDAAARANYMQTSLSLASSLNLTLLDRLAGRLGKDSDDRRPLLTMIQRSRLMSFLKRCGYRSVAFASGYWATEVRSADNYLSPAFSLDEFQSVLLGTTPIPAFLKLAGSGSQQRWHRERIAYAFDRLARLRELPGGPPPEVPLFAFAHIVCPHPPFVFGPNGEPLPPARIYTMADGSDLIGHEDFGREDYIHAYRGQVTYVSQLVARLVRALVPAGSTGTRRPAVVILQADHGPGSGLNWEDAATSDVRERLSILNAVYFPDGDYHLLYPGMTPANVLRCALNQFLGTDLELLPDRSYFSTASRPYDFQDVTERVIADHKP